MHQRRSARLFVDPDQPQAGREVDQPHRWRGRGHGHVRASLGHAPVGRLRGARRSGASGRRDQRQVIETLDTPYRGGFVGHEHRFALSVYFEDTDTAGVVYYANYLKFMERARSDMLRAVGIDQRQVLERGQRAYYVAEVNIRYLGPARLGDDLVVASTVEQVRAASVVIQQRVIRGDELLTEARVTAAFLDANGRPQRQPIEWTEKFKAIASSGT